jgi:hypothetical protein
MEKKGENKVIDYNDDTPPPDNGPWYCNTCVWLGTMYDRFD